MIEKLLKAISLNDEDYTQEKENVELFQSWHWQVILLFCFFRLY